MLALRRRLRLVVLVLLAVLLLMMAGVACACLTDHPIQAAMQAADGTSAPLLALPPLVVVWALLVLVLVATPLLLDGRTHATGRASPSDLQRFLL